MDAMVRRRKRSASKRRSWTFPDYIAYSVHDFEDALFLVDTSTRLCSMPPSGHGELMRLVGVVVRGEFASDELDAAFSRMTAVDVWPESCMGGQIVSGLRLQNFTSHMIGRFSAGATHLNTGKRIDRHVDTFLRYIVVPVRLVPRSPC